MFDNFLDFPAFKEKYPDKTLDDWLIYSKQQTYEKTLAEFNLMKHELTELERNEVEKEIEEMKQNLYKVS